MNNNYNTGGKQPWNKDYGQKKSNGPKQGSGMGINKNDRNVNYGKYEPKGDYAIVQVPLSKKLTDPAELYLEKGIAYNFASDFKDNDVKPHQMRKVLDSVKTALNYTEKRNFERAKKQMFMIVTMSAYNSGRDNSLKQLYRFVKRYINQDSIQSIEDIKAFDQLYTSIVAYHTFLNKNNNGGKRNA